MVRQSRTSQRAPATVSSTHPVPYIFVTILLTIFKGSEVLRCVKMVEPCTRILRNHRRNANKERSSKILDLNNSADDIKHG